MNKNFKFGFTLAEVLVALAITGVVASITIPSLIAGAQNRKLAASLGRSVEAIESGCQLLLHTVSEKSGNEFFIHSAITMKDIDTSSTSDTQIIADSKLFENASDYFNVTTLDSSQLSAYKTSVKNFSGQNQDPSIGTLAENFVTNQKFGAYYGISLYDSEEDDQDDPIIENIYIDVNGFNSPNRYGYDIYLFGLTDSCHMIPAGTNRMNDMASIPLDTDGCKDGAVTNGLSCTSRVVKDGYRINYKK